MIIWGVLLRYIPLKMALTERKYEPIGNVIMATVKARSLKMMDLWMIHSLDGQ